MPRLETVLVLLLAMPAISFANSDPVRNTAERRQDHRQITVDRTQLDRDTQELRAFEQMTAALKDACEDRMASRYRDVNAGVQNAIDREVEQAAVKSAQSAREVRGARREVRGERMEATSTGSGRDALQAFDDGHDRRDDARDRNTAVGRHDEMARIATMSGALQNEIDRGDRRAMQRNVELVEQFLELMRRDLAATQGERSEDRAELREDRRETRTDRR